MTPPPTQTHPLTFDELCNLPDDGQRHELIAGVPHVSPVPNRAHQEVQRRLGRLLDRATRVEELGRIYFAPVDVRLSPHDIVQPDIRFIRWDRLASYQPGGVVEGAPDLVVEIVSPSSRLQDDGPKKALYARSGVREYWLVDPAAGGLRVFVQNERGDRFGELAPEHGQLHSTVLPIPTIDIAALFAGIRQCPPRE